MKTIYYNLFLIFLIISNHSNAQQYNDTIPKHETFTIQSTNLQELRTINVWTPLEYETNLDSLTVLYMPDGGIEEDFPHIANTLAELIKNKKIEPIILVGIENTQRRRDLTGITNVEKDKEIAPVVGGSENFRSFISDELFFEINKRYRTTNKKGIIGESLAGLFIIETFFMKPDLFDYYIAFDPSLWWNNKFLIKKASKNSNYLLATQKALWFGSSKEASKIIGKFANILKEKNFKNLNWEYSNERKEKHNTIYRATKEKAIIWTLNNVIKQ